MKLAMTDMDIIWENKEKNREQCCRMVREAAGEKADGILFPEMTLTGFSMDIEKIQDKYDETITFFSELAKKYHLFIGFGYVSVIQKKGRNHFCLVDQKGACLADYEKIHPFTYGGETAVYEGGSSLCQTTLNDWVCGMFICYDLRFPECFQKLPMETDVVFVIANWPESRIDHWYTLLKARAIEMQCYVVGINRTGIGDGIVYTESSAAFSPDGCRLPEKKGEQNRYIELDRRKRLQYIKEFPVRQDRKYGLDYTTTRG